MTITLLWLQYIFAIPVPGIPELFF